MQVIRGEARRTGWVGHRFARNLFVPEIIESRGRCRASKQASEQAEEDARMRPMDEWWMDGWMDG